MPYLNTLQDTKLSKLHHLDIAYIAVLLPLLLIIKAPMLLFMGVVLALLVLRKESTPLLMTLMTALGIFAIFLSSYGSFNFAGLSRLKLFLELLIYILIFAVSLQRLTREINFYLLLSPLLILALSLFFFHSVVMLGYVIVEIFVLLWVILSFRMQGSFQETFKMAGSMFAFSLPWVIVLFIFFPRISFEHASYGFKGEGERRMGHDGTMFLDNNALLVPSNKIVMEIGFQEKMPPSNQLYFRGSILYLDKKDHWAPMPMFVQRSYAQGYTSIEESITYKVTLYPTLKRWLYMIDSPQKAPKVDNHKISIDVDFISKTQKDIDETLHYQATSALKYTMNTNIDETTLNVALDTDITSNPKSWEIAKNIKAQIKDPKKRADAIIKVFKQNDLTYTLKPKALDLNNSTDSFLFDKKLGYCVHFASAFVNMARMSGIPARVVTGYKANPSNGIQNYLVIKEKDAHAWAELLIDNRWTRYETTAWASSMDSQAQELLDQQSNTQTSQLNLYMMYVKYQIETWILHYSHFRQLQLLDKARKDPLFIAQLVGTLLVILLLSFMLWRYFRQPLCHDKLICLMQPLLEKLQKEGYKRADRETMHQFLIRCSQEYNKNTKEIDKLYEVIRYGGDNSEETFESLKKLLKAFK